jgi:hypothetical protein
VTAVSTVAALAAAASLGPYAANAFSQVVGKTVADEDRGAFILAASDVDDDDHEYRKHRRGGDHDEDSEDDDDGAGATPNPAPAGTVSPPANGLFGDGPAPRVKVN